MYAGDMHIIKLCFSSCLSVFYYKDVSAKNPEDKGNIIVALQSDRLYTI